MGAARGTTPSSARAMTTSQWWDAIAIRVDSKLADSMNYTINLSTPDTNQNFIVEMSHGTLSNKEGFLSPNPDVTISMNRSDLNTVIIGDLTLAEQLRSGIGTVQGNVAVLEQLAGVLVDFEPGFEIMPGTK